MNPERWQQIEKLYHAALEREPDQRAAFLAEACPGDEDLRREVAALLAHDDPGAGFLSAPALQVAARRWPPRPSPKGLRTLPPVPAARMRRRVTAG